MQQHDVAHEELQEMQWMTSVLFRSGYSTGRLPKFLLSVLCHKLSLCRYLNYFPLALAKDWRKPNLCTVEIRTLGKPGIRPDARRVSKARLLSQTLANLDVANRHINAIAQDCRSKCRTAHSYVRAWYRTDRHIRIHLDRKIISVEISTKIIIV